MPSEAKYEPREESGALETELQRQLRIVYGDVDHD